MANEVEGVMIPQSEHDAQARIEQEEAARLEALRVKVASWPLKDSGPDAPKVTGVAVPAEEHAMEVARELVETARVQALTGAAQVATVATSDAPAEVENAPESPAEAEPGTEPMPGL